MISILALAAWITVAPNGMREIWISDNAPVPGQNIPADYQVIKAKKDFSERDLFFVQSDGEVVRPPAPEVVPGPNAKDFQSAIFADQDIPLPAKLELIKFFPLVEKHAHEPEYLKPTWAALVAVYGSTWLTEAVQAKVEAYAAAFRLEVK